jgi:hypothetical protein
MMYILLQKENLMATKVRKQIYIEPHQDTFLKRIADEAGISEAEFIRQAIDHQAQLFRPSKTDLTAWANEKAFITDLIEQGPIIGGRTWQREELYER